MDNQTPDQNIRMGDEHNEMPKKSGVGSIIATVLIIAIIIIGALYFWGKRIETERADQAALQSAGTTTDETAAVIEATSTTKLTPELQ